MPVQQCRSILIPRLLRHIALHPPAERQWIRELEAWLRQVVEQHPTVRVLGMCFGAQVLTTGAAPPAPCRNPVHAASTVQPQQIGSLHAQRITVSGMPTMARCVLLQRWAAELARTPLASLC